jgi:hypothetical protein
MSGRVIFECAKRGGVTVRFINAEYQGSKFVDIREWVERDGELVATRKGATLPLDALEAAGVALTSASRQIDASGAPSAKAAIK